MDTNALISGMGHMNSRPKSCAGVGVCVCVSIPNTLLFATYLTLIRSEITYVFILYKPMPISIGENVMHVILSSLA